MSTVKDPMTLSQLIAGTLTDQSPGQVVVTHDSFPATKAASPNTYPCKAIYRCESNTFRFIGEYTDTLATGYGLANKPLYKCEALINPASTPAYWPEMIQLQD